MGEIVKRYDGQVMLGGTVLPAGFKTGMVSGRDYDALHQQVEGLRAENHRQAESLRIAHHNLSVGFDTEAMLRAENERLQSVCAHNKYCAEVESGRADQASAELETARGLIEKAIERAVVFDDGSDGADAESARSVVAILRQALTATPAREVQQPLSGNISDQEWINAGCPPEARRALCECNQGRLPCTCKPDLAKT